MNHRQNSAEFVRLIVAMVCLLVGIAGRPVTAEQTEILRITVGKPTFLSPLVCQGTASVAVSRTGVAAAFYPKPGTGAKYHRTSTDGGVTWGPETDTPDISGGAECVALRDGGVLKPQGDFGHGGEKDWYAATTFRFTDDFTRWETETAKVYVPDNIPALGHVMTPSSDKGKIVQLPDGSLLMPMFGRFSGDVDLCRVFLVHSTDQGRTWRYYATVHYGPKDPNPELPGHYGGPNEPTIALLPNGQLICVMRTQYSHLSAEYRPLYVSWSDDQGKTWTKPVPSNPHLMNVYPTLAVLDNGVVACVYGRPGFHVAFSIDNGHTWRDRISFSDLPVSLIMGYQDMIRVGPNRLAVIGSDADGVKVWPIRVERVKLRSARTKVTGSVLDQEGRPIGGSKVELGPNRYTADSWVEGEELDDPSHWRSGRVLVGPPALGYRSISTGKSNPTAKADSRGQFQFKGIKLAEYVLTVEADGYAPQWIHINVGSDPKARSQEFRLKAGKSVRGRVVDETGKPVGGACVVLDKLHIHADSDGRFSWAVDAPVPDEVAVRVYKRYHDEPGKFDGKLPVAQIEAQPIVLQRTK